MQHTDKEINYTAGPDMPIDRFIFIASWFFVYHQYFLNEGYWRVIKTLSRTSSSSIENPLRRHQDCLKIVQAGHTRIRGKSFWVKMAQGMNLNDDSILILQFLQIYCNFCQKCVRLSLFLSIGICNQHCIRAGFL